MKILSYEIKTWEAKKKFAKRLYYRGELDKGIFKKSIAIVGSRRMSRYGAEVVDRFVAAFVAEGVATISGFMYGVDTMVHQKTVDYGGRTVAVFGCGLDVVYPSENEGLYKKILETGGLVVSQFDPQAKPHLWKFLYRNKVVVGLASLGVLVVEAGMKSGSIGTGRTAAKMGKKVYAVPGAITSSVSQGTNQLIKEGTAKIVTGPEDILGYRVKGIGNSKKQGLDGIEKQVWEALGREGMSVDELAAYLGKSVVELSQTLTMMAIKGMLTESGGKYFVVLE